MSDERDPKTPNRRRTRTPNRSLMRSDSARLVSDGGPRDYITLEFETAGSCRTVGLFPQDLYALVALARKAGWSI